MYKPILLITALLLASCAVNIEAVQIPETAPKKPKNIILVIGDGTGLSQISAAQFYKNSPSNYDRFPVVGLIKTSSSSDVITDSAAGATAFASGIKTFNGAVGVRPDSTTVPTLLEVIAPQKIKAGLIATSSITHATPACFYAHDISRNNHENIAQFLPKANIQFFAGAGLQYFNKRKDGINLIEQLKAEKFIVDTIALHKTNAEKVGYLLAPKSMPKINEGRGNFLEKASILACEKLENENGFFLMVEASQVDWGGHDNDANYLIEELIDLDNTLGVLLDFAQKNGETLIIATADHETGGFSLSGENGSYSKIAPSFSTKGHTATMVPVFAFGPGAQNFGGVYENTEVYYKILSLFKD